MKTNPRVSLLILLSFTPIAQAVRLAKLADGGVKMCAGNMVFLYPHGSVGKLAEQIIDATLDHEIALPKDLNVKLFILAKTHRIDAWKNFEYNEVKAGKYKLGSRFFWSHNHIHYLLRAF